MDEKRVADYFIVAGLPDTEPELLEEALGGGGGCNVSATTAANAGASSCLPPQNGLSKASNSAPITDIGVLFPRLGEHLPEGYEVVLKTPSGLSADLNHGSLRTAECYLCFRRGRDKPPLVDIGVMYEGKESLMEDAECVSQSVGGHTANVNNSTTTHTFLTYRRTSATQSTTNALVVTDICVVITSKGESPPHAFCCIPKNLNKGLVGSDVFLCYKKSMNRAPALTYKPAVLARFPHHDLECFPLPVSVALFCLPMGATLELWPKAGRDGGEKIFNHNKPRPVFSTFVLTVSDAKYKVYGAAVTFYEQLSVDVLSVEQREKMLENGKIDDGDLYGNKSICVLSHFPFSNAFESWLLFLHSIVASGVPQPIPVERYIVQLFDEVPFPSPRTLLTLRGDDVTDRDYHVIMTQPDELPLPRSAASFRQLLYNLGAENCLLLLLLVLTEQKILIHSLRPDTLTAIAEAVCTLLYPFKWQCPYIPLCPLGLVEVLHAPLPFLIGVDSRFFDLYDPPPDVCCIDLDTNIITVADAQRQVLNTRLLPKKAAKILKNNLDSLHNRIKNPPKNEHPVIPGDFESEFRKKEKEQSLDLEIQEAFLRFMALTLKGYRSYLKPITKAPTIGTTDPEALFQLTDFLKSRDKTHQKFFTLLMRTQMFIRFIEERSFVTDGDQGLAFFDECCERLTLNDGDVDGGALAVRLIDPDALRKSDRTIFVLPPRPIPGLEAKVYTNFTLDANLMMSTAGGAKKTHLSSLSHIVMPGSPMARRTKHEIKTAQKLARNCLQRPEKWARCLCGACHTLYFMVLPSMLSLNTGKEKAILQQAYELLVRATKKQLTCDEVCYRLMMQLCGEHSRPLLAVKLLVIMKKFGIQPNALTYGLYNRCVLEAEWTSYTTSSQVLWTKLRNVIIGAAQFRSAGKQKANRKLSASTEGGSSLLEPGDKSASRSSLDSTTTNTNEQQQNNTFLTRFKRVASIVRGSLNGSEQSLNKTANNNGAHNDDCNTTPVAPSADDKSTEEEEEVDTSKTSEKLSDPVPVPISPVNRKILTRTESGADANILDQLLAVNDVDDDVEDKNRSARFCARTLSFGESAKMAADVAQSSPGKVSPRTQVTQNDPLGALIDDNDEDDDESCDFAVDKVVMQKTQSTPSMCSGDFDNIDLLLKQKNSDASTDPILFRSQTFERCSSSTASTAGLKGRNSSTLHHANDGAAHAQCKIHRSETVPAATVASSLANLGSTFKIGFSRYSPSRLSLRKADLKMPQQFIENAFNNLSPSSLTGKKSNEIIQGGFNSIKSAATNMVKKLDEIKEAISLSANTTPIKQNTIHNGHSTNNRNENTNNSGTVGINTNNYSESGGVDVNNVGGGSSGYTAFVGSCVSSGASSSQPASHDLNNYIYNQSASGGDTVVCEECESTDGSEGERCYHHQRRRASTSELGGAGGLGTNHKGSFSNLKDFDVPLPECLFPCPPENKKDCELEITITSCSQCHNCLCLLYDEDIMANWSPEDSNLNTMCQNCLKLTVPLLTITITNKQQSNNNKIDNPFSVPYLSPLVLRKELENVLGREGDLSIAEAKFVDDHPIIYWNLVWIFERINVQTHLPNLFLRTQRESNKPPNQGTGDEKGAEFEVKDESAAFCLMKPVEDGTDPLTLELAALVDGGGAAASAQDNFKHLAAQVSVKCVWDEPRLHTERRLPMYILWNLKDSLPNNLHSNSSFNNGSLNINGVNKTFMQKIITSIRLNQLEEPLRLLSAERDAQRSLQNQSSSTSTSSFNCQSYYRDILFLACEAIGRCEVNLNEFDKEYLNAFTRTERTVRNYGAQDRPIGLQALYCRQYFRPLTLQ